MERTLCTAILCLVREPRSFPALVLASLLACGEEAPAAAPREREVVGEHRPEDGPPAPSSAEGACAADLAARTPAPVRTTLGDLGYDRLFEDACLAQQAETHRDAAACAELSVSTLRERCVARVAIASARPSDCPAARTMAGRDPLCVALAARDRRLCAVGSSLDRAVCEAALGRDVACAHLRDAERDVCTTRVADLGVLDGDVRTTPALEAAMSMRVGSGTRPTSAADRGVRVISRGCTRVLVLGDQSHLTAPFGLASMAFDVVLVGEPPIAATLSTLPSDMASTLSATVDGIRTLHATSGSVTITRLELELGGVVEGTIHAAFAGQVAAVDATFTTFVRDLDPPCAHE